jgi:hypothetical protein
MARGGDRGKYPTGAPYSAALPSDFSQMLRQSLMPSLGQYFPPPEDIPSELRELLARLDEKKEKKKEKKEKK